MPRACHECGKSPGLRHGRCAACGAAVDFGAIRRHQRRAAILRVIGEEWYWWVGEIMAVALIALVVGGVVPSWTLAVAGLLLLRPLSRLIVLGVRGAVDVFPG